MRLSYFMIPRCVNKKPVGEKQCIKIQKQKAPGGNSELGGEENLFFCGNRCFAQQRRGVGEKEKNSKEVEETLKDEEN